LCRSIVSHTTSRRAERERQRQRRGRRERSSGGVSTLANEAQLILDAVRRIEQAIRNAARRSEGSAGLSAAQLLVLAKLSEAHGNGDALSLNELARRTLTHQSSASVIVSKLVARRLVRRVRSSDDHRRQALSLTQAGHKLIDHAPPGVVPPPIGDALSRLPRRDVSQLARLLRQFVAALGIAPRRTTPMLKE
jgi:DNA-binding MarR family transcriptional regulator